MLIRLAIIPDRWQAHQSRAEVRGNQGLDGTFPITNVRELEPKRAEMSCCSGSLSKSLQTLFILVSLFLHIKRDTSFFSIAGALKIPTAFPLKFPEEKTLCQSEMFPEIMPGGGVALNALRAGLCAESHRSLDSTCSI